MSKIEKIQQLLAKGKITRREFIARTSALGLAAAITPALFAVPGAAATPKKGGRFRVGLSGASTTDDLDPATIGDIAGRCINWQIRNNLVEIDAKGVAVPELAENWEITPDAAQWTFNLRKGVEFHNGKTLDAEDVIWSVNYHRGEASKSPAKSLLQSVEDIKADGKYRVIFKLSGGNADFSYNLSDQHIPIVPAGTSGEEWGKGIGTGGYQLVEFVPGVRVFTKRNPNYWKANRAHFDEIESLCINDTVSRTNALRSGAIDAMSSCDMKTAHLLAKVPGIKLARTSGQKHYTFPMLMDKAPYDNPDVRMALKYAINRENMIKVVLHGFGTLGNDHPIAPTMRFYASDLPQRQYDPDKAKYFIKKSGLADHTFKLHTCKDLYSGSLDAAVLYKEYASKAGIKFEVAVEPKDGYWNSTWIKKDWCASFWTGRPTPDMIFTLAYAEDSGWNESHFKSDRFNSLLIQARAELDDAKRHAMYSEMQHILYNDGGSVIPLFADIVDGVSTKIGHAELSGNFELDGDRCHERWWFV